VEEEEREAEDADAQAERDRVEEEEALAAVHACRAPRCRICRSASAQRGALRRSDVPFPPLLPPRFAPSLPRFPC
jgi:hypothetical protein